MVVARVQGGNRGIGLDAPQRRVCGDMMAAGIIDPVKVSISALRNAARSRR